MKQRIWEIDALRGFCVLAMIAVHLIFDLVELYGILTWEYPAWFSVLKDWGGVLFLLISGISVTLGSRSVRRGGIVFACGLACTAVTYGLYRLGFAGKGIVIWFGALHCLGCCMMLWPIVKHLPTAWLAALGVGLSAFGVWLQTQVFSFPWLVPLGFLYPGFISSDYFPLIRNFGFFLIGAALGRVLYADRKTRFPNVRTQNPAVRFLTACGRSSLPIYLLHQPVLAAVGVTLSWLVGGP